jgi:uncharacterized glyoxalase superfamily protein PhnB
MSMPATPVLTVMLAIDDVPTAIEWYQSALGARVLWSMGSVAGLEVDGAPIFLHHSLPERFSSPRHLAATTARVELFVDDPDAVIARALGAGAIGSLDDIRDYEAPWGTHRQGGFIDPFGHSWSVGDRSPLRAFPPPVGP